MTRFNFGIVLFFCIFYNEMFAQYADTSNIYRLHYSEVRDLRPFNREEWSQMQENIAVSFADDNIRYPKHELPVMKVRDQWSAVAWKGEKVATKILVWTRKDISALKVVLGDLRSANGTKIEKRYFNYGFVRFVMADEFGEGCDERYPGKYDSTLVEDPIDIVPEIDVEKYTVQPIWLSINIPNNIPAGDYKGRITIFADRSYSLGINIVVLSQRLPTPDKWKFDLDLWQNPDPIAKLHHVELWSKRHYEIMRPYYTMLAAAGQKSITTFIIDQPWGPNHVFYKEPGFIKWKKDLNGKWQYDYSIFDNYVNFVMSCGIDKRINCYSMISWGLSYSYFDEKLGKTITFTAKPGSKTFNEFWTPMILDFTKHLKKKGWFSKTAIAMDERDLEGMMEVIKLVKSIDVNWKVSLAGNYHPELADDVYDYSVIISQVFDDTILRRRKAKDWPSTFYTACGEMKPNLFSFSSPSEVIWLCWYAAAKGYTGYLRWAYNSWTENSLTDSRFRAWPSGDCFQIYPGPRTSIRFEKLIEGIQDFEKIRILREQFINQNNYDKLTELNTILSRFNLDNMKFSDNLNEAKKILNGHYN